MVRIGVLALQGSIVEHIEMLNKIEGVVAVEVKQAKDMELISGLIIPGGESTTIAKLMNISGLTVVIKNKISDGMPVWGTCAGAIILAKEIINEKISHLGVMNISVRRNAYGSQLDSFKISAMISKVSMDEIPLVFIRAPIVESVGNNVEVLCQINGSIVAVEQDNLLATSFHPELTKDLSFHKYFAKKSITYNFDNI